MKARELIDIYFGCENEQILAEFILKLNKSTLLTYYTFNFKSNEIYVDLKNIESILSAISLCHETPFYSGTFDLRISNYLIKDLFLFTCGWGSGEYEICMSVDENDIGMENIKSKVKSIIELFAGTIKFTRCRAEYESTEEIIYEHDCKLGNVK